ncbi:hypothetical protein Sste5346_007905 [Sporothrix stenoceras]|uniref:Uncharacterized protein n=1 Tax=Sporothrix stenoceras TaxID=5173 RepID=A0ABR3YSS7_9PEZI
MSTTTEISRGQYLQGPRSLKLEARQLEPLAADSVRIAIRSTTICGSDVHYYTHFANGSIQVKEALCLGHESAGLIVAVGSDVANLNVGDRVAVECGVPCSKAECAHCSAGRYNICPALRFRSSGSKFPHYQGTLQDFVDHPAAWVHRLPSVLDFGTGALLEPLAVAVHAVRRAGPTSTTIRAPNCKLTCLVFGAGAIGLLCAVAARAECGNDVDVVMVDIDEGRLQFAKEHCFASVVHAIRPRRGETLQEKLAIATETAAEIAALTLPDGTPVGKVQRTFECTGAESCLQSSIYATAAGGSVIIVGMGIPSHTLPIADLTAREINLTSTWRYASDYERAIEIAAGSITGSPLDGTKLPDVSLMITHRFKGLDSVQDALEMARKTRDDKGALVVKTVVDF